MDLTKILNKGWLYVIQTIIIIALFIYIVIANNPSSDDYSIREDVISLREQLDRVEANNSEAINLIDGLISSNERITRGLDELTEENRRARDITSELANDNIEHTRRIRAVQDSTLDSELVTDRVKQIIREIERDNNYD